MSHEFKSNNTIIVLYCVVNLFNNKVSIVLLANGVDVIMYRMLYVLANTLVIQRQPIRDLVNNQRKIDIRLHGTNI